MKTIVAIAVLLAACSNEVAGAGEQSQALDACAPPAKTDPACHPVQPSAAFTAGGGKVLPGSVRCEFPDGTTWEFIGNSAYHYVTAEDPPGLHTLLCTVER